LPRVGLGFYGLSYGSFFKADAFPKHLALKEGRTGVVWHGSRTEKLEYHGYKKISFPEIITKITSKILFLRTCSYTRKSA